MSDTLQSLLAYLNSIGASQKLEEPNTYWVSESRRYEVLNFVADMNTELWGEFVFVDFNDNQSIKIQFYAYSNNSRNRSARTEAPKSLLHKAWQYLTA